MWLPVPIPRDWEGQPAFVIGGGPSVAAQNVESLKGRNVIVVNSSYEVAPWADLLFFGDYRWWNRHKHIIVRDFPGRIVTTSTSVQHPRVVRIRNARPNRSKPGVEPPLFLSVSPTAVPMRRTSFAPAINIAFLRGANPIVLLGADGKPAADGTTHHHKPHPWKSRVGGYDAKTKRYTESCWDIQRKADMEPLAKDLAAKGIEVLNASPDSGWKMWPIMTLAEALERLNEGSRSQDPLAG